jgi:hypothetical protein
MLKPECKNCPPYSNDFKPEINPFETELCLNCPDRATMWMRMVRAHESVPRDISERLSRLAVIRGSRKRSLFGIKG